VVDIRRYSTLNVGPQPIPEGHRQVTLDTQDAKALADLSGVEHDLFAVQEYCERCRVELGKRPHTDMVVVEALVAAALVRYCRTHGTGVRAGLPQELIDALPRELREMHDYCKDARDKWISHSVNTFEENQVSAWLVPSESGSSGVAEVTVQTNNVVLPRDLIDRLTLLAETLGKSVRQSIAEERANLLSKLQAMPGDALNALYLRQPNVGNDHPSKARPKPAEQG
jgi:hypothetical protein